MLWKRNLSIQTPSNPSHLERKKNHSKPKPNLAPIPSLQVSAEVSKTVDAGQGAKFHIRKRSKSIKHLKQHIPCTFYLNRGNNFQLVKSVFEGLGFEETVSKQSCCLIWYQGKDMARKDFQRKDLSPKVVNYFPNHSEITNKQHLYENIVRHDPASVGDFLPQTFVIDFKENLQQVEANLFQFVKEFFRRNGFPKHPRKTHSLVISNFYGEICILFSRVFKQIEEAHRAKPAEGASSGKGSDEHLWIVKPSFLNRGQGIQVISSLKQLQKILGEDSQQISIRMYQSDENNTPSCYVIQEYIMNPLLYKGYKFDIRVWMLLRKTKKNGLEVYLYKKGYARLAGHKYLLSESENEGDKKGSKPTEVSPEKAKKARKHQLADPFVHLTNNAVQKNCKQYGDLHEGNQIPIEHLVQELAIPQLTTQYLFQQFSRITNIMVDSCKEKLALKAPNGTFQLMGLDFMVDTNNKVWLIEANCNPCLEESSAMLKQILPRMLRELLEVIEINEIMGTRDPSTKRGATIEACSPAREQEHSPNQWSRI